MPNNRIKIDLGSATLLLVATVSDNARDHASRWSFLKAHLSRFVLRLELQPSATGGELMTESPELKPTESPETKEKLDLQKLKAEIDKITRPFWRKIEFWLLPCRAR